MASSPSSSSLRPLTASSLRQLVSLDSPRLLLGNRVSSIKKARDGEGPFVLSSTSPPPEVPVVEVKKETDDSSRIFSCALCTSRPGDEKLTSFCSADPRRAQQLASLLGRSEEEVDIIFCSDCRQTVTKLFNLKEEVEEIEARIQAVVKLHPSIRRPDTLGAVKVESPPSTGEGKINDEDCTPLMQSSTTSVDKDEPRSQCDDNTDNDISESSDPVEGSLPVRKSSRSSRGQGNINACQAHNRSHRKKVHKRRTVDVGTLPPIKSIQEGGRILFLCPQCPHTFTFQHSVFKHLGSIHGHGLNVSRKKICPLCKKGFYTNEIFEAHCHPDKNDPSKVSHSCQLCPKFFGSAAHLRRHKRQTHLKMEQRDCPHCGKQFQTTQSLHHHSNTCGVPLEEQRKCHCGQEFASWAERFDHERVVHKRLTSTKCYFCSKFMLSTCNLFQHLRTHTRERQYFCVNCGKDFRDPSTLRHHRGVVCGTDEKKRRLATTTTHNK